MHFVRLNPMELGEQMHI